MSDSTAPVCPDCGHDQVHWELQRLRTRNGTLTLKVIHWTCPRCGHSWFAPTQPVGPLENPGADDPGRR